MLQSLRVKNLAIVQDVRVEFANGLNVITGETGAGKSILVGALSFVLGERADRTLIRTGEEQCGVEAIFALADPASIDAVLEELGIDTCDQGRLLLRRIVSTSGAGKNLVNDCPTTVQALKRIGDLLVDMHGPHDHQSLLNQDFQLDILDSFGHLWKTRAVYEAPYAQFVERQNRRRDLESDGQQDVTQQLEFLSFQVKEIEAANLTDQDEGDLEQEHKLAANSRRILELSDGLRNALTEGETSIFDGMTTVQKSLDELSRLADNTSEWRKEAEAIAVQVQELSNTVSHFAQGIEGDPARLQWLEERMTLLHNLKRKYGSSVKDMLAFLERSRERLRDLETRGARLAELDKEIQELRGKIESTGAALSEKRRAAAKSLSAAITKELRDLGFPHGVFEVLLETGEPQASGLDRIDFGFAPNAGETMRPLRIIASSGEISRVMLAIKAVLATHDKIPVLVFDEIDANVGGEMGNAIGAKLGGVAGHHQVLCITHLPQVAVHGAAHYVVVKQVAEGRTHTDIQRIEGEARAEEIARMLGGRDLTSVTLKHAREMLRNA